MNYSAFAHLNTRSTALFEVVRDARERFAIARCALWDVLAALGERSRGAEAYELGYLPFSQAGGALLFHLLSKLCERTSVIADAESARVIDVLPTGVGPHEVDVSPDGRTAVVANYGFIRGGNSLTVIDVPTATVTSTITLGEHSRPHGVVWLEDNRRVAVTAQGSKHLLVVDVAAGEIITAYPTGQEGSHMVAVAHGHDPVRSSQTRAPGRSRASS